MSLLKSCTIHRRRYLGCWLFAACMSGCDLASRGGVRLLLHAQRAPDGDERRLDIRAEVAGKQAGLRYQWFAVAGECDPQEGEAPTTVFKFADGARRDRVSVEAWRDGERVAQSQIDVKLEAASSRSAAQQEIPKIEIEVTNVPPWEPDGGPDTRSEIAGKVSGEVSPEYKVVIYARADSWYMQPTAYAMHAIRPDNTWGTWTHTGSSYAVLVVRPGFDPFLRLDVLPQLGGYVLARTIVEGKRG